MDDDTDTQALQAIRIDWENHIVSFHEEAGYERLEFSTKEEKMDYAFQKTFLGFRIQ